MTFSSFSPSIHVNPSGWSREKFAHFIIYQVFYFVLQFRFSRVVMRSGVLLRYGIPPMAGLAKTTIIVDATGASWALCFGRFGNV